VKTHFIISLIVVGLALFLTLTEGTSRDFLSFMLSFGTNCCLLGGLCIIIGLIIMAIKKNHELAKAFLISAGITFLIGTGACGVGLASLRSH